MSGIEAMMGDMRAVIPSPWVEVALVAVSFLCGATVGIERERHDKPAGLRTLVLICVGSTTFTLVSMSPALGGREPARVAAQIVTGVGFLGAGSIIRERFGITGLTTAATVWATAGVGMVIGAGYATAGVALSLTILLTLATGKFVEERLSGACRIEQVVVRYRPDNGRTRVRLQQALDGARGPVAASEERAVPGGLSEITLSYCAIHREHRSLLAALVDVPSIEAIQPLGGAAVQGHDRHDGGHEG
jgi:putative Mg2+ transporter-C (MgtC) family protein